MARPLRIEYPGAFYHIVQRGNERREIFVTDQDRAKFYDYIAVMHSRYKINIHTYSLMGNHYHLIMETEEANLSRAMHCLNTSYTVYFNKKRKRAGHLFQGRYKAILVEADEYLHHLSRYIHLNPVKAGLVKNAREYPHSSLNYFMSEIKSPKWLNTNFILSMFDKNVETARSLYGSFVSKDIGNEADIIEKNTKLGFLLGTNGFIENIKTKYIEGKDDPEISGLKAMQSRLNPEDIRDSVIKIIGENKLSRKVCIYLIRKYTQLSLNEIAVLFKDISDAGISAVCCRLENNRRDDKELNRKIGEIEKMLKVEM